MRQENFSPVGTVAVAAPSTASQRVDFAAILGVSVDMGDCLVTNDTDKTGFIKFGDNAAGVSPVVAALTDTPIRPGAQIVLSKEQARGAAVIMSGAPTAGSFYFTIGIGS